MTSQTRTENGTQLSPAAKAAVQAVLDQAAARILAERVGKVQ